MGRLYIQELSRQINAFCRQVDLHKSAGLLKVPEKTLAEVCNWAEAKYCAIIARKLRDRLLAMQVDFEYARELEPQTNLFEELQNLMYYDGSNPDKAEEVMRSIFRLLPKGELVIPGIHQESDNAIFNSLEPSLRLTVSSDNGLWNIYIETDINKKQNVGRVKEGSALEAWRLLNKFYDTMDSITFEVRGAIGQTYYHEETIKETSSLMQEAKAKGANAGTKNERHFSFPVSELPIKLPANQDISNIEFQVSFIHSEESYKTMNNKYFDSNDDSGHWAGFWARNMGYTRQYGYMGDLALTANHLQVPVDSEHMEKNILEIKSIIRHELQHCVQDVIETFVKRPAGLPSKNLTKNKIFNPNGVSNLPGPYAPRQPHPERDIEFYTRLSDSVDIFKREMSEYSVSNKVKNTLAKIFVGEVPRHGDQHQEAIDAMKDKGGLPRIEEDYFFKVLKEKQPEKYQKAVKEFYKAINS